jgi:hypothetical protein
MNVRNKLECLSLTSLFSLVKCLLVRLDPTLGAPFQGRLLASPTSIGCRYVARKQFVLLNLTFGHFCKTWQEQTR